jgi:HlyD family secretion protein
VVGTLEWDRVELIAELSEPIVQISAREGQTLAAGDSILQLDPARTQARLAESEAAQAQAQGRLAELARGPRSERIDEARAKLAGAQDDLDIRERERIRLDSLLERKLASAEAADTARRLQQVARAERDQARAALAELLAGTTVEELEQAEAALAQAKATAQARRLDLERLSVRAPVAGRLDDLPFHLGEQPAVGQAVALLLAGAGPYARVYVPESLRVQVRPGTEAHVRIDGQPTPIRGRVRKIQADPAFTPYYALTERDRGRLSYLAEIDLLAGPGADLANLPAGLPLEASVLPEASP